MFKGSIGRTDFPKGDYQTLIDSIVNKLWPLGEDIKFIPGHGPMSTFAARCAATLMSDVTPFHRNSETWPGTNPLRVSRKVPFSTAPGEAKAV
ncbi:hypothetical protein [Methylomonas koyamae]|uniref:hypothetical protein n=1 Tax=Methylomonas koyamae TaxID=702114 RepID=UPI00272EA73E|nr:hypothetical protein [Methylomonas koyamae]